MSHGDGRYDRSGMPIPHPCVQCGQPTIYLRCDACHTNDLLNERQPGEVYDLGTSKMTWQEAREIFNACLQPSGPTDATDGEALTLDDVAWLIDTRQIGGALDGDEFAHTLTLWRREPATVPAVRYWSGVCLWCARELREQSGDDVTHTPLRHQIRTCYRHRKALLALSRWVRNETFGSHGQQDRKDGAA